MPSAMLPDYTSPPPHPILILTRKEQQAPDLSSPATNPAARQAASAAGPLADPRPGRLASLDRWRAATSLKFSLRAHDYERQFKMLRARWAFEIAAVLHPTEARWSDLARMLLSAGKAKNAEVPIIMAMSAAKGRPECGNYVQKAMVECAYGRFDGAERWLSVGQLAYPRDSSLSYALGSVWYSIGRFNEADACFSRHLPVMTGTGRFTNAGIMVMSAHPRALIKRPAIQSLGATTGARTKRAVLFAAADSAYFVRYARQAAASLARSDNPDVALHFHIINPDAQATALAEALAAVEGTTITFEVVNLDPLTQDQARVYYSCARFAMLEHLLKVHDLPLIVVDIDQLVMKNVRPLLDLAAGADCAVLRFKGAEFNILSLFSATLMVVAPTAGGREFATRLEANIINALGDRDRLQWHLDQAALARSILFSGDLSVVRIPASMIYLQHGEPPAHSPADHNLFWSITHSIDTNASKLDSPTFRRFTEPVAEIS